MTIGDEFSLGLLVTSKSNTTQLTTISKSNAIDILFIEKNRAMKKIDYNGAKADNINIIDIDSTRSIKIKLAISKNLV